MHGRTRDLRFTFTCPGRQQATLRSLRGDELLRHDPLGRALAQPDRMTLRGAPNPSSFDELCLAWAERPQARVFVSWQGDNRGLPPEHRYWDAFLTAGGAWVKLGNTAFPTTTALVFDHLREVDHDWAGVAPLDEGWLDAADPRTTSFSEGHYLHGFACAFKGADGHRRLAHRRWLEHGPWRLVRDEEHDVSIVQFHELDAPVEAAIQQAVPGHALLGATQDSGFIPTRFTMGELRPSSYDAATKTSIVVVPPGGSLSQRQIWEACALRANQLLPDHPVDQVAFVFLREQDARPWLHPLWLRGLEVRAITDTGERRLDTEHHVDPPPPPDWVKREQDRDGLG